MSDSTPDYYEIQVVFAAIHPDDARGERAAHVDEWAQPFEVQDLTRNGVEPLVAAPHEIPFAAVPTLVCTVAQPGEANLYQPGDVQSGALYAHLARSYRTPVTLAFAETVEFADGD